MMDVKETILSDPDKLRLGVEIDIDINRKTIKLYRDGNLKEGQIDWRAIYSFLKKIWREVPYRFIMFPVRAIDRHEFELING